MIEINDTLIYNETLKTLDNFQPVYAYIGEGYVLMNSFRYYGNNNIIDIYAVGKECTIQPSDGYAASDLYSPQHLISDGSYTPIQPLT